MTESERPKIRYYTDERNDDFSGFHRTPIRIDGSYRYLHENPFGKRRSSWSTVS